MNVTESEAVNVLLRYLFKIDEGLPWEGYLPHRVVEASRFLADRASERLQAGVRSTQIPDEVPR